MTGRIIKGIAGSYTVSCQENNYICQARGLFRKQGVVPLVGDIVDIDIIDKCKFVGYLLNIHSRKNEMKRPKIANIDLMILTLALRPAINYDVADALLIFCEQQKIDALICLNKSDLDEHDEYINISKQFKAAGYSVLETSVSNNFGIEALKDNLFNKTSILAGPSGVGKSSLLNALLPHVKLEIGDLSKKVGRGRHTTRHSELLQLNINSFVADTPGFTSFNINEIPKHELQNFYREFTPYRNKCYYINCLHISEHDCAIKKQVGITIHTERYDRYARYISQKK